MDRAVVNSGDVILHKATNAQGEFLKIMALKYVEEKGWKTYEVVDLDKLPENISQALKDFIEMI